MLFNNQRIIREMADVIERKDFEIRKLRAQLITQFEMIQDRSKALEEQHARHLDVYQQLSLERIELLMQLDKTRTTKE